MYCLAGMFFTAILSTQQCRSMASRGKKFQLHPNSSRKLEHICVNAMKTLLQRPVLTEHDLTGPRLMNNPCSESAGACGVPCCGAWGEGLGDASAGEGEGLSSTAAGEGEGEELSFTAAGEGEGLVTLTCVSFALAGAVPLHAVALASREVPLHVTLVVVLAVALAIGSGEGDGTMTTGRVVSTGSTAAKT